MPIKRRTFLSQSAAWAASSSFASRSADPVSDLQANPALLKETYDILIIGSGYGGSVAAARLAPKFKTGVLERGKIWNPGDFPESGPEILRAAYHAHNRLGLFVNYRFSPLSVLVGSGLGGTSLINAGVVLEPDRDLFQHAAWPREIARWADSPDYIFHMQMAQSMLDPRLPPPLLQKSIVHEVTTRMAGGTYSLNPIAYSPSYISSPAMQLATQELSPCSQCGNCVTGCNGKAKKTLDQTYLPLAKKLGADLFTGVRVTHLTPRGDNSFAIHAVRTDASGKQLREIYHSRYVLLAAGAVGSTKILLQSQAKGGITLSPQAGAGFSANGDLGGFCYNSYVRTDVLGHGTRQKKWANVGPTISSTGYYNNGSPLRERFIIQEGAIPSSAIGALRYAAHALGDNIGTARRRRALKDLRGEMRGGALNHSMLYLGMGHDNSGGKFSLNQRGKLTMEWPDIDKNPVFQNLKLKMHQLATQMGGEFKSLNAWLSEALLTPYYTVHPLGGCSMANAADSGTTDHKGRVFTGRNLHDVYKNLYVMDGSVLPHSVGKNPLLTITALAERASALFIKDNG